jgi:hypothetical protein
VSTHPETGAQKSAPAVKGQGAGGAVHSNHAVTSGVREASPANPGADRERPKPTPVTGWIYKDRFRYWCKNCIYWHTHTWDSEDVHRFSHCGQGNGSVELISLGIADEEVMDRIEAEDPPPGQPRRGETLKTRTAKIAWLAEYFQPLAEEFKSPRSTLASLKSAIEPLDMAIDAMDKLSHGGPDPVRERDLLQEISDHWRRKEQLIIDASRAAA